MSTVLDTRSARRFTTARLPDSANIPLEELPFRVHELPAANVPVRLFDDDPARVERAVAFLTQRGHRVECVRVRHEEMVASGSSLARLWQPTPFLVECLGRIGGPAIGATAIDVASGTGRDAVYLALQGYDVTAIDCLPDALERAERLAASQNVTLRKVVHDLERDNIIPAGPADLVCIFRYLHRPLFPALRRVVRPGGHLIYETFHERNLETARSPRSPAHLLRSGELEGALRGFKVLMAGDAIEHDGRYFSRIFARRPMG